jgi:hypothetical protein
VGVGGIFNTLKYNNKKILINKIICIINGIFHGIYCVKQGRKHRYHERQIGAVMVVADGVQMSV